jgi:hypothetical protein
MNEKRWQTIHQRWRWLETQGFRKRVRGWNPSSLIWVGDIRYNASAKADRFEIDEEQFIGADTEYAALKVIQEQYNLYLEANNKEKSQQSRP